VEDLCQRFVEEHLPKLRPSTQKDYRAFIESDVLPALRHAKVADLTFASIDGLHRKISKRAPYVANRVHAMMSKMLSMAVRWAWRADNPARGVERNPEVKRTTYLTGSEIERLMAALAELDDRQAVAIIRLLLLTGARSGEVLAMRWEDVDFESGTWTKPAATTKQKTVHRIPLSAPALMMLSETKSEHRSSSPFVFPGPGRTGHRESVKKPWAKLCRQAGIEGVRVHDLRHSYASILASRGLSLPVIGRMLGHTQPSTTSRYAHLLDDPLRAAAEIAASALAGGPSAEVVEMPRGRGSR
jgi:integrase